MTKEILNELEKDFKPAEKKKEAEKPKPDKFNAVWELVNLVRRCLHE